MAAEKLSPKSSLNPFAKDFTTNKPSNGSANSWTPSFPNLGGQKYPSLTFIPSSFSPPPTPVLPTENMTVNINTSVCLSPPASASFTYRESRDALSIWPSYEELEQDGRQSLVQLMCDS